MNRKATIRNAKANIEFQNKLAKEGKDFSTASALESERLIELAEKVFFDFTREEKANLKAKALHPNPDYRDMKETKERLSLSWNELKIMSFWCVDPEIKILREERNITQQALADAAGISIKTLQDYEGGRKDINGAAAGTVKKLAEALGCRMEDLID